MVKECLFIPGNNTQLSSYPRLMQRLQSKGYTIPEITMDWTRPKDPNEWANQVRNQVNLQHHTVIGFSFGGATALLLAAEMAQNKCPPKQLLLCSHSGIFREDIQELNEFYTNNNEPIPEGWGKIKATPLIKKLQCVAPPKVTIFYGSDEINIIKKRADRTARELHVEPIEIFNAAHDLENPYYLEAVINNIV